jgi:hypothetical protein
MSSGFSLGFMKQALFAACAVVAITRCTTYHDQVMAQLDQAIKESQNRLASLQREADERDAAYLKQTQACILTFPNLKIGDDEGHIRRVTPCKLDHVNTTETASGLREQWVYEFLSGNSYLYFDNGKLVAKQI